jgi:hypothetical protein
VGRTTRATVRFSEESLCVHRAGSSALSDSTLDAGRDPWP